MPTLPDTKGDFVLERAVALFGEAAQRLDIDVDLAALAPTRRRVGGDVLVPTGEYQAVLRGIFSDPRETLGIDLARAMPVEATGLWGFLLRSSPTYGDMLRRAARYMRVFFRFTRLTVIDDGVRVVVACDHPRPSPFGNVDQEVGFFLGQWLTWGRALIGDDVRVDSVRMRWVGPDEPAPYEAFFGCPVLFGSDDDAMVFDRRILELPLPEQTPELTDMLEGYAGALIRRMTPETGFVDRVREVLAESLVSGGGREDDVADRLGITKRTMRRRLAEADLTFRELRHQQMRSRAEQMLADSQLPIAEISYLLGYGETSSFHRAFRRWTGLSPGEWRTRHADRGA